VIDSMFKKKKNKMIVEDHGETISNMNVEGFSWYQSEKTLKKKKMLMDVNLTPKERRAVVFGAFVAYLPLFLIIVSSFVIAYLLFYFFM